MSRSTRNSIKTFSWTPLIIGASPGSSMAQPINIGLQQSTVVEKAIIDNTSMYYNPNIDIAMQNPLGNQQMPYSFIPFNYTQHNQFREASGRHDEHQDQMELDSAELRYYVQSDKQLTFTHTDSWYSNLPKWAKLENYVSSVFVTVALAFMTGGLSLEAESLYALGGMITENIGYQFLGNITGDTLERAGIPGGEQIGNMLALAYQLKRPSMVARDNATRIINEGVQSVRNMASEIPNQVMLGLQDAVNNRVGGVYDSSRSFVQSGIQSVQNAAQRASSLIQQGLGLVELNDFGNEFPEWGDDWGYGGISDEAAAANWERKEEAHWAMLNQPSASDVPMTSVQQPPGYTNAWWLPSRVSSTNTMFGIHSAYGV